MNWKQYCFGLITWMFGLGIIVYIAKNIPIMFGVILQL